MDPEGLDDETGHDDPEDQKQYDRVIRGIVRLSLITEPVGPPDVPPVDGQKHADQDGQAEEIHEEGEDQVEGSPQEGPARSGSVM